ncbi:hypothetical protein PbJCM13498_13680 [Prolixibacter bellariivorans]|uniref:Beta-xylosidase C-terminal Concanavalin A-like domain-containing protein n=1 Tax=Prolixibacter bellariivorans TaxID=314319 RepID=A0A5M4AX65_9BACT|nr:family 43 glycosylhydrolase [Prolixibacter bellariivorans]GET32505.1 hypothetical protein PbJCM13498_13680 [Prolixibacter bellariivorans]
MKKRNKIYLLGLLLIASHISHSMAQQKSDSLYVSKVWVADNGDGTYKNPVLHADYSDLDAIRVGTDFYMTASSFNCIPGLPILQSKDLVNWYLIGYALQKQPPFDVCDKPQHGNGVWAPCIRYHDDEYYIFYPDPDYGIYMIKAKNPKGPWSGPLLIKAGKGLIDPSPLWNDDNRFDGEEVGLIVMGEDYQYIKPEQENKQLMVKTVSCHNARKGNPEKEILQQKSTSQTVYFRLTVLDGAVCSFSFSADGKKFIDAGGKFHAVPGRWIGAKVGLFALRNRKINDAGNADIDWFRIEK